MENTARVLIVDDEAPVRRALARALRRTDFEIDTVDGARSALKAMETHDYHLIISDLKMPETDGVELLTTVSELYPQTSRMLLSGHADRADLNDAINRCRVDQYLDKPWDNQQLIETIGHITFDNLRQRDRRSEARLIDEELDKAMQLQRAALPTEILDQAMQVRWMFQPCHKLGGDGLNYWRDGSKLHFYMIDVAGHGLAAAMESFAVQQQLNGSDLSDPASVTAELNRTYMFKKEQLRYFTMLSGCIDLQSRTLTFCQAGHPGALVVSRDAYSVERHGDGGFPVGLLDDVAYENQYMKIGSEELVMFHSDGLAESHADEIESFLFMNSNMQPADLAAKVAEWRAEQPIDDDISALFITLPDVD